MSLFKKKSGRIESYKQTYEKEQSLDDFQNEIISQTESKPQLFSKKAGTKTNVIKNAPEISPEILNMLWFANGKYKNYSPNHNDEKSFAFNGLKITMRFFRGEEPSLIDITLPISQPKPDYCVERPPYFPSYKSLTPDQRWKYWSFLSNPYDEINDIGYVFIFYYGLERHLFEGDFGEAFDIILKLRDVYSNKSFQNYSANAIVLSCIYHRRADYAIKFLQSLDKDYELNLNADLFLLCKAIFDIEVSAEEIIKYHKAFAFANNRYIKNNEDVFVTTMRKHIHYSFGKNFIKVSDVLTKDDFAKLPLLKQFMFANLSMQNEAMKIPDILKSSFGEMCLGLLQDTHEDVKKQLAEERKKTPKTKPEKANANDNKTSSKKAIERDADEREHGGPYIGYSKTSVENNAIDESRNNVNRDTLLIEEKILQAYKIVNVSFKKNKSKSYGEVVKRAKHLPNYRFDGNVHSFAIDTAKEYVEYMFQVEYIISQVNKWQDSIIELNGKPYTGRSSMWEFKKCLQQSAGEYAEKIAPYSFYDNIELAPIEDLPLPYVLYPDMYGAFLAFKESTTTDEIFFCECEKTAIENYIELRQKTKGMEGEVVGDQILSHKDFPSLVAELSNSKADDPISLFKFKKGICHKCNNKVPENEYCAPMYGTAFMRKYGWFVNQKYYQYGIDYSVVNSLKVQKKKILRDKCPEDVLEVWDKFIQTNELYEENPDSENLYERAKDARRDFEKYVENAVRKEFGFKNVGEAWVSETALTNIIKSIYPECEVKTHYRPDWLEGLELDIFIPNLKLGIEYQGQQHYAPVEHWGGEKQFEKQKEHDLRKARICKNKNIKLLEIKYDEELTEAHIREKLNEMNCII